MRIPTPANDDFAPRSPYEIAWAEQQLPGFRHHTRQRLCGVIIDYYENDAGEQAGIMHGEAGRMKLVEVAFG